MVENDNIIDFKKLPYTELGHGTELSSDYIELYVGGECFLCLGCVIDTNLRRKALLYHYGVFGPRFGDMKYLEFDIRELFGLENFGIHELPLKVGDRLIKVSKMIEEKFETDAEFLKKLSN